MRTVPAGREDDLYVMTKLVYIAALVLPLLATCGQPEEDDASYVVTIEEFSPENHVLSKTAADRDRQLMLEKGRP